MPEPLRFSRFEWHPEQRRLLVAGLPSGLGARALDLLDVLIRHRDQVISKNKLLDQVWPGLVVEENNLSVQISALRKVLGEDAIATVSGRGYRWALPVETGTAAIVARRAKPSIAILPFHNLSGSPDEEYFADGLAEDVVASLSRSPWLFVVASSSSFQFRDGRESVADVCRALGVQYLMRGTFRRHNERLRVGAELIDGSSGEVVWAERYDRPIVDLFQVQDEIAAKIVGTIEPAFLKQEEKRAVTRSTHDLLHWELVMRARWHYWRSSKKHSMEARLLLEQALQSKPDDVNALSLLAFSLATEVWSGWAIDAKANALEARRLATRAVRLDDSDAFAHFALGVTLLSFGELDGAIAEQRCALAMYPHFAAAAAELGRLLAFDGDTVQARTLMRQAMDDSPTDPRMPLWLFGLGIASFVDGAYAEAIQHAHAAIALRRDWFFNHFLLATSLVNMEQLAAARASMAEGMRLVPTLTLAGLRVGHPFKLDAHWNRYVDGLRKTGWTG